MAFDESTEEWRPVEGFPSYEVSSLGRVRSLDRVYEVESIQGKRTTFTGKAISPFKNKNGYMSFSFCVCGKKTKAFVHRVVCKAFKGPAPSSEHQVNHINGVRDDNRAENLEWLTAKQNAQHSFKELGRKVKKGNSHYRSHIIDTAMIERLIASGMSHADIVRSTGTTRKVVFCIAHGKHWSQR